MHLRRLLALPDEHPAVTLAISLPADLDSLAHRIGSRGKVALGVEKPRQPEPALSDIGTVGTEQLLANGQRLPVEDFGLVIAFQVAQRDREIAGRPRGIDMRRAKRDLAHRQRLAEEGLCLLIALLVEQRVAKQPVKVGGRGSIAKGGICFLCRIAGKQLALLGTFRVEQGLDRRGPSLRVLHRAGIGEGRTC